MKFLGFLSFLILFQVSSFSQKLETNAKGEKIIKFSDGSWRYYQPQDSVLFKRQITIPVLEQQDQNSKPSSNNPSNKTINQELNTSSMTNNRPVEVKDLMLDPPAYKCEVAATGIDEYTKNKRTDLAKEVLFTYTAQDIASYLKGHNYLTCTANFTEFIGDIRILNLNINIASRAAKAEYGYVKGDSYLSIKLINGEAVSLPVFQVDAGRIDNDLNETNFKCSYTVSKENQKQLQKSLVDKIRIVYSTGYEEYIVQNLDFFQNQISCLNNL